MKSIQAKEEKKSSLQNIEVKKMAILNFNQYLTENNRPEISLTAGVAIIYNNKILLVHPTNGSWKTGSCGIPKGRLEPGEDPIHGALRELREETGIVLAPSQLNPLMESIEFDGNKKKKVLYYFLCEIQDLSEIGLISERVPKDQLQLEEVDWAKFVSPKEAYPITSRSQLIILDRHLQLN
jgi:ADP-ribose pyrophosphatase YjhB (NUDIX family)